MVSEIVVYSIIAVVELWPFLIIILPLWSEIVSGLIFPVWWRIWIIKLLASALISIVEMVAWHVMFNSLRIWPVVGMVSIFLSLLLL